MRALAIASLVWFSAFSYPARAFEASKIDGWTFSFGGFAEMDAISDSSRAFREVIGNAPVPLPNTAAGGNGRFQTSVRNSRLSFTLEAPEYEGWKTKGYVESDFLGFDPAPGQPNQGPNSEGGFFNNPTMRIRHAYLQGEASGWSILAGQTWQLFGWQPSYFLSLVDVSPTSGFLYGRTQQVRAMKSFGDETKLQFALAALRAPQADANMPDLQAGARIAFDGRKSGFTGGPAGPLKLQPMSFGASGLYRQYEVPTSASAGELTRFAGSALALDAFIPVLAANGGTSVGNTLSLLGEFTQGSGYGDQFAGWSGGIPQPLSQSSDPLSKAANLDAGIGDFDANGQFQLVNLRSFAIHAQYHLPTELANFVDAGFGQLESNNMAGIARAGGKSSSGANAYDRESSWFVNFVHGFTPNLRGGIEYVYTETGYVNGEQGTNRRVQAAGWYVF